jgi:small-conductance mechanosensitive channel
MSDQAIQIIISVVTMLIALGVGLYLRRLLVRGLKKTVLDNWLIQLLGILVIISLIIVGTIVALFINGISLTHIFGYIQGSFTRNLIASALIILLAIGLGRTLMKLATAGVAKNHISINIRILLGRICYVVVMTIAFIWILSLWDLSFTLPAAIISIITVGLTFVLQDLLKNLVAGLYLLIEGPFKIGDKITTDKYTGKVEDVQLRATKLRIGSGEQAIVPNAILFSDIVINKTIYKEGRATITITMQQEDFETDQTTENILNTLKEVNGVMLKPEPELRLMGTAGSFGSTTGTASGYTGRTITLALRFWLPEGQDSIVTDAMLALRTALPHADLAISEGL